MAAAKAGRGQALVLRGEAGIGKTALLDRMIEQTAGCRVGRVAGVESEMGLPFAGLHQLCGPYLDRLGRLPAPQREALGTTFGLRPGRAPDRFLVGLAVLTLLGEVAEERPLICVVEDAQWLDHASAQTLEFVARRLTVEPVAMVFAVRDSGEEPRLAGLPALVVRGLSSRDAAALLQSVVPGPLDSRVRDRILAESRGNPLALLELPRELTATELTFGGVAPANGAALLVNRLEQGSLRQLGSLPQPSRQLLLTAAAEPVGDVELLWSAAERLGIGADAAAPVEATGLVELRDRVRFRHPILRPALYRSATPAERRAVHRALADVTDPDVDPDRRAWHRARGAAGPDEGVAAELERSADLARARGGIAAAAAFLETAAMLTPAGTRRAERSLAGAQAKATAGAYEDALALLAAAESGPLPEDASARIELLRAQITSNAGPGNGALPLLLAAARRLEPLDWKLSRETYLDALSVAVFAGRLAARQVAQAARLTPQRYAHSKDGLLLEALAVLFTDGYPAAAAPLHRAVQAFAHTTLTMHEGLRFVWLAALVAVDVWDDVNWDDLSRRHLAVVRAAGAFSVLPLALSTRALFDVHSGDLAAAAALVEEARWVAEVTGGQNTLTPYGQVCLAAMRGDREQAEPLIEDALGDVPAGGEGLGLNLVRWAQALLYNGHGRYVDALEAAQEAAVEPVEIGPAKWALAELVEAGVRCGSTDAAAAAFEQLSALTSASGTELALGVAAGRCALLRTGDAAEQLYREAIERLRHTRIHVELARVQLLYGEWLRREGRRVDARAQLRTAFETLTAMGVEAFAERARRELVATGETVRRHTVDTRGSLTAQELHIARLAADGLTNPEIAAVLYISPRTVEWHLRKVFTKLGISNRRELRQPLLTATETSDAHAPS